MFFQTSTLKHLINLEDLNNVIVHCTVTKSQYELETSSHIDLSCSPHLFNTLYSYCVSTVFIYVPIFISPKQFSGDTSENNS